MEIHKVLIALTLLGKLKDWDEGDVIIFSAFIQCLREFEVISTLGGFDCMIESANIDSDGRAEIIIFWMALRGSYIRLILREVADDCFVVSDR